MSGADILSDLIRAANKPNHLCNFEREKLLERAAENISDYREALNAVPGNNLGSGDIVVDLYSMAYTDEPPSHQAASEVAPGRYGHPNTAHSDETAHRFAKQVGLE